MNGQGAWNSQAAQAQAMGWHASSDLESPLDHAKRRANDLRHKLASIEAMRAELELLERMIAAAEVKP